MARAYACNQQHVYNTHGHNQSNWKEKETNGFKLKSAAYQEPFITDRSFLSFQTRFEKYSTTTTHTHKNHHFELP